MSFLVSFAQILMLCCLPPVLFGLSVWGCRQLYCLFVGEDSGRPLVLAASALSTPLRELGHADGCSQLELVQKTHLKAPTVSVTLKKLEEEGLVVRRQDEMDNRVTRVFLSQKGHDRHEMVHERLHTVERLLMQGFDEAETAQLLHYLERMRNNILPENKKIHTGECLEKSSKTNMNGKEDLI